MTTEMDSRIRNEIECDVNWSFDDVEQAVSRRDKLTKIYNSYLRLGQKIVVMPASRLDVYMPVIFPRGLIFFPPAELTDLQELNIRENREDSGSLAEVQAAGSGVTTSGILHQTVLTFPCNISWKLIEGGNHQSHLELIRRLSEEVDRRGLNLSRYQLCRLGATPDMGLPARAGQLSSNKMMAGAAIYCGRRREGRILGGTAFSSYFTAGLGLPMEQLEWNSIPKDGEIGHRVKHALSLYTAMLETTSATNRFVQAICLLEFLAGEEYQKFQKVKRIIAKYLTQDRGEYDRILSRFKVLTADKDPESGEEKGLRTRIIHMGSRLEDLEPSFHRRIQLFRELDRYIRPVIDHMIAHSEKTYEDYLESRPKGPFNS